MTRSWRNHEDYSADHFEPAPGATFCVTCGRRGETRAVERKQIGLPDLASRQRGDGTAERVFESNGTVLEMLEELTTL